MFSNRIFLRARFFIQRKNDCSTTEKSFKIKHARVAELADALDLGSSGETCGGSNPPPRTTTIIKVLQRLY